MNKRLYFILLSIWLVTVSSTLQAVEYRIDTEGAHASINFKIKHLGYSWLTGRFNTFKGRFKFDPKKPESSNIELTVQTKSIDSNHAERDKHLRGGKYLNTSKYPTAKFTSTSYKPTGKSNGVLAGNLTLHGVTRPVSMKIRQIGAGKDPWGGFRRGFETSLKIRLGDYGIKNHKLGPASETLELDIYIEGIKDHKFDFQ